MRSTLERNWWNISKILMNAAVLDHVEPNDSPRSLRGLTAQQLLAMPESDYMSAAHLAFFRTKLEMMRTEILAHAQQAAGKLREEVTVLADPADRATIGGRTQSRTVHARTRAEAPQVCGTSHRSYRLRRLWLVRRNR